MLWDNRRLATAFGLPVDDGLTEEERKRLQRQAMMQSGAAMLAGSGWSDRPITTGQGMAAGLMAGQEAYSRGHSDLMQQRQAMAERQRLMQQQQAEQAFLQGLSPEQVQLAKVMGVGPFAKMQTEQKNREATEAAKAKSRDNRTTLQKEAEALYPDDKASQNAYILQARNKPATSVQISMPGNSDRLGRLATPEEMAQMQQQFGIKLPPGVGLQMTKDGWKPIQGTLPTAAEDKANVANAAKGADVQNANMLFDQMEQLLDQGVQTGPIAGSQVAGVPIGRAIDYDRKTMFDAFVKQVSPSLRAVFRIPGEGALSDSEQKQYGLMLPSVEYPEQVNRQLMNNLRVMLGNKVSQPADDDDALISKYLGN